MPIQILNSWLLK